MWPALERSLDATHVHHPADLRRRLLTEGGFTLRIRSGASVSSGICVATRPAMTMAFPIQEWEDRAVDEWMSRMTARSWPASCIGGWLDRDAGTVWLDSVQVVPALCRRTALALGRRANQRCVFDLDRHETVALR